VSHATHFIKSVGGESSKVDASDHAETEETGRGCTVKCTINGLLCTETGQQHEAELHHPKMRPPSAKRKKQVFYFKPI